MSRREAAEIARTARNAARAAQNAIFLRTLRCTANISMAAEAAGLSKSTMQSRRTRDPDLAARWATATAFAHARLKHAGTRAPGAASATGTQRALRVAKGRAGTIGEGEAEVTEGGEYAVRRRQYGIVQVRRAAAGELSAAGERAFLAHLAATANITLSAQAVGVSLQPIYDRRRRSAAFAAAMQAALAAGHEALEMALLESAMRALNPDATPIAPDAEAIAALPPAWASMTPHQALHLLALHRKTVALGGPLPAHNARAATREETDAALLRLIEAVEARVRRREG